MRKQNSFFQKIGRYSIRSQRHLYEKENITGKEFMKIYRELKGIPEPEEENVAKQGSSVDFRVGEEATHTVDLNKGNFGKRRVRGRRSK